MTIGEALKSLRLHAGMNQTQMAAGIVTESFYSKVERGVHAIDADVLIQILTAHHFDVTTFLHKSLTNNQRSLILIWQGKLRMLKIIRTCRH
ncbi:helix-turn-helix transcriptional regulator [Lactobacillus helveticus]|uniref:helix-turn-helix domain-containing protein n=1 Tax=Lactobacillus helveticus TaxID=1587 RepID=UPI001A10A2AD|nr:helix-turn-helix transcriptional regulator [Lactobacillus helveticus]MCO0806615.1 helix-turn-helix domain-containing protein [Lactobacillus helveticus]MDH5817033.1 helix-turn-helix transcriptional regulator [Lactobacillus helveticus]MDN6023613.1 helix-turn-helix domain-containing protein [Lactobacillus sp.]NRO75455.1 hypothetical protein [Lactobacillus helveticus]